MKMCPCSYCSDIRLCGYFRGPRVSFVTADEFSVVTLAVYVKVLLHSVSYSFPLYRSPPLSLCKVFDAISSNIDEIFLTNPFANMVDFNVHHNDWLTYYGGID